MKIDQNVLENRTIVAQGPETTTDQWVAIAAVVDHGGYAAAAEALDRSQSAVSYQVTRLQEALGSRLLKIEGRRAVLSAHGEVLLSRVRGLLKEWCALESFARTLEQGYEAALKVVVDAAFPRSRLIAAFLEFKRRCPSTQLDLIEAVLSGAEEAIVDGAADGSADVVVTAHVPKGFLGDWLYEATFVACASPQHPLHELGRTLTRHDLEQYQQVVLRDSGTRAPRNEGYLGARMRWTVGGLDTSIAVVEAGLAYAWLPQHLIEDSLAAGRLKTLPLESGAMRKVPLYLVLVRPSEAGPAARVAAELLHQFALGESPGAGG